MGSRNRKQQIAFLVLSAVFLLCDATSLTAHGQELAVPFEPPSNPTSQPWQVSEGECEKYMTLNYTIPRDGGQQSEPTREERVQLTTLCKEYFRRLKALDEALKDSKNLSDEQKRGLRDALIARLANNDLEGGFGAGVSALAGLNVVLEVDAYIAVNASLSKLVGADYRLECIPLAGGTIAEPHTANNNHGQVIGENGKPVTFFCFLTPTTNTASDSGELSGGAGVPFGSITFGKASENTTITDVLEWELQVATTGFIVDLPHLSYPTSWVQPRTGFDIMDSSRNAIEFLRRMADDPHAGDNNQRLFQALLWNAIREAEARRLMEVNFRNGHRPWNCPFANDVACFLRERGWLCDEDGYYNFDQIRSKCSDAFLNPGTYSSAGWDLPGHITGTWWRRPPNRSEMNACMLVCQQVVLGLQSMMRNPLITPAREGYTATVGCAKTVNGECRDGVSVMPTSTPTPTPKPQNPYPGTWVAK